MTHPTHQTFTFEVTLKHVGMDFSMGKMTDEVRKLLKGLGNISPETDTVCVSIKVEKETP